MDEVRPGLWIGNIRAITQLDQIHNSTTNNGCNDSYHTRWTVITILKDDRLLQFVRNTIAEHRKQEIPNDSCNCTEVVEHVEWIIPDTMHADFVSPQLLRILETIDNVVHSKNCNVSINNKNVTNACLVHCAQGVSRSAAVVVAFLLYTKDCTNTQAALDVIRKVRPCVQPNVGFLACLRAIEQCHGDIEAAMERIKRHENKNWQQPTV